MARLIGSWLDKITLISQRNMERWNKHVPEDKVCLNGSLTRVENPTELSCFFGEIWVSLIMRSTHLAIRLASDTVSNSIRRVVFTLARYRLVMYVKCDGSMFSQCYSRSVPQINASNELRLAIEIPHISVLLEFASIHIYWHALYGEPSSKYIYATHSRYVLTKRHSSEA